MGRLRRWWGHWQFHAALAVFASAALAFEWSAGPYASPELHFPLHHAALVTWSLVALVALITTDSASRAKPAIDLHTKRSLPDQTGFRVAANASVEHSFRFSVGEQRRFVTGFIIQAGLAWIGLSAVAGRWLPRLAEGSFVFSIIAGANVAAMAAYVALQSRRSIVVSKGQIAVRDWTGWTRRLAIQEDVRLVMRDLGGAHVLEAFSGGLRLHLARVDARDAFALEAQLREAIAETCGVALSQELVPLSRPGGVPP